MALRTLQVHDWGLLSIDSEEEEAHWKGVGIWLGKRKAASCTALVSACVGLPSSRLGSAAPFLPWSFLNEPG